MAKQQYNQSHAKDREKEFEEQLVELKRVTRTVAGGKRLSFMAIVLIGDKKGRVGLGIAKAPDVATAINKASQKAKKNIINIPINEKGSVPHWLKAKFKAAEVLIRPAPEGHGITAGGAVRMVLELAGFRNITAKMLGSQNKLNNLRATFKALENIKKVDKINESKKEK